VHALEQALDMVHSSISPDDRHPLLTEDLIAIANEPHNDVPINQTINSAAAGSPSPGEHGTGVTSQAGEEEEVVDVREGLGTLTFHPSGKAKFFGPTAAIEVSLYKHPPRRYLRHYGYRAYFRFFFSLYLNILFIIN